MGSEFIMLRVESELYSEALFHSFLISADFWKKEIP